MNQMFFTKKSVFQQFRLFALIFFIWFMNRFDSSIQNYISIVLLLSIGLWHGANDINLARSKYLSMSFWKVLGLYVLLLLTVGIIFLTIPKITVLFLLLLSSYHFGSDFVFKVKNIVPPLGIGWMVLSTLFFINTTETQVIFQELLDIQLSDSLIQTNFYISAVLGAGLLLYNAFRDRNYLFLIGTVVLFLGFWSTDLITGFTAYFIFWHSIPSVIEQSVDHTWTEKLNVEAIKNFFRRSFLYYAISLVGVILYFYLKSQTISSGLTLVILMVLSVPHVLVIDLFKRDAD